jgi:hypothetical protein
VQRASAYSCIGGGAWDPPNSEGDAKVAKARLRIGSCRAFSPQARHRTKRDPWPRQITLSPLARTLAHADDVNNTLGARLSTNVAPSVSIRCAHLLAYKVLSEMAGAAD